jgi:hypothetical protein
VHSTGNCTTHSGHLVDDLEAEAIRLELDTTAAAAAAAAAFFKGVPTGSVHSGGITDTTSTTWLTPFRQKPRLQQQQQQQQHLSKVLQLGLCTVQVIVQPTAATWVMRFRQKPPAQHQHFSSHYSRLHADLQISCRK